MHTSRRSPLLRLALVAAVLAAVMSVAPGPFDTRASAAAPPVPTGLAFSTVPANGDTTFTWTASPGATGHRVTCESQDFTDVVHNPAMPATSTTMRLAYGTWLCDVAAFTGAEFSARSLGVIVTIAVPPAPTGVTATAYSGKVTVSWVNPGGVHIDGWKITSTPASETRYVFGLSAPSPSTVFSGIPVGVPHTFTVTPYRASEHFAEQYGTLTATSAPVTVLPTPGAPIITHVDSSHEHVALVWTPPASTGGSPITGYRITMQRTEYEPFVFEVPATLTSVRIDGVDDIPGLDEPYIPAGQEYNQVSVAAKNINGYGGEGIWPGGTVWSLDPASPVGNLYVATNVPGYTYVYWDEPEFIPGEINLNEYDVEIIGAVDLTTATTQTQTYFTDALPDGWYQARVRIRGGLSPATWATRWFAVGEPCDSSFPDVTGPPFCTHISWLVRSGITTGFADGNFRPTQAVSRQSMAAFLYRAKGSPRGPDPTCATAPFSDVSLSNPFCGAIDWLVDEGIAAGFVDGTFKPTQAVSRQAMAAFLYRASSQTRDDDGHVTVPGPCADAPFPDVPVSHPFCGYINWMGDGLASGFPDGTFRPTQTVTRQSMASFLYRWRP